MIDIPVRMRQTRKCALDVGNPKMDSSVRWGGVNPENETSKMGTVLMGGTVCYDEIADIQPGVQGCGGISD